MIPAELMQHTIRPADYRAEARHDHDPQDAATQAVQRAAPYLTRHAAAYIAAAAVAAYRRATA